MSNRRLLSCTLVALAIVLVSFFLGAAHMSVSAAWNALIHSDQNPIDHSILVNIRLPRIAAAIVCGAALSVAGTLLQAIFSNPIVDSAMVGISGWASCGAALSLLLAPGLNPEATTCIGSFVAAFITCLVLARSKYNGLRFTLYGIALGALAGASLAIIGNATRTPNGRSLTAWLYGTLSLATWTSVVIVASCGVAAALLLARESQSLDIVSMGSHAAHHLGIDVRKRRFLWLSSCVLLIAPSVAFFGAIGFIGLAVPHIGRILGATSHRQLLPISAVIGAAVMCAADTIARSGTGVTELPLSLTLALCGAPVLFIVLRGMLNE